jgi:hypothetical protein
MSTEWFYTKPTGKGFIIVFETADKPICAVNDEEHAQLIAAAPEMLNVLKGIHEMLIHDVSFEGRSSMRSILQAAIAKAEGRQP